MNEQTTHETSGALAAPGGPILRAVIAVLAAVLTAACIAWSLDAPSRMGVAFYTQQLLALVLGLGLGIIYFSVSWRGKPHAGGFPWFDVLLGIAGLGISLWICVEYERLLNDVSYYTSEVVWLSIILVPLVLEALRRCTGWALVSVVVVFIGYALVAEYAPMVIRGKPASFTQVMTYLAFDTNGLFGTPLKVGAEVVILFLFMGDVLIRGGGGEFFIDLAKSLLGHKRGGPAKICVVGSGLFGMISGSAVSNVASVGPLTIPMMIRTGYSPRDAGAIEAVGSTGGQLMPPVMGAAAFLMAEFLEIPYGKVALAAAIPAVLYYLALYWQVDLIAAKERISLLTEELPKPREVLRDGWHFIIPFVALIFMLFYYDSSPENAALSAAVVIFVTGMIRGYRRPRLKISDLFRSLAATGRTTTDLVTTLAAAGFVIGVLNSSGLGFALTLWLVGLAGNSLPVLLVISAFVALILGMGMPTTAVYVLLAVLAAPALVQAGVMKLAAHMFILYFGMLSMITPPVALAAYAASTISKAGPMETGWAACRIGWAKFVLPFMFVLSPTLLLQGAAASIAFDILTAMAGVYIATCGLVGYFMRPLSPPWRVLLCVAGLAAIIPDSQLSFLFPGLISVSGIAVGFALLLADYLAARRRASPA
ncbi:MAG: TRAP transporter fused permease subunit [Betaproteobacteria bacterium]|nr:TRAP transporter fused permease subunit [Betaproteobacteria bacterium]